MEECTVLKDTYKVVPLHDYQKMCEEKLWNLVVEAKRLRNLMQNSVLPEVPDLSWRAVGELKEVPLDSSKEEIFKVLKEEAVNCIKYQEGITLCADIEWPEYFLIALADHLERELGVPVEGYNKCLYVRVLINNSMH